MTDPTENIRRNLVDSIHNQVKSNDKDQERKRLEEQYGRVWDTTELTPDFEVLGFMAPFVVVRNRETGEKGTLLFQHHPRFYFCWKAT